MSEIRYVHAVSHDLPEAPRPISLPIFHIPIILGSRHFFPRLGNPPSSMVCTRISVVEPDGSLELTVTSKSMWLTGEATNLRALRSL